MSDDWLRRGELWLRRDAEDLLRVLGITTAADAHDFRGGEELRRRAETSILRLEHDGRIYYLKRFHYDALAVFLRSALKLNRPVRSGLVERANLLELTAAGFRVPRPLAAGFGGPLKRRRSFVLLENMPGDTLEELIQARSLDHRAWRKLGAELGGLIRRFHQDGFWHRDLYLCHIAIDAERGLGILDGERVKRRVPLPERWRIKDLAALHYSSRDHIPASARTAFLKAYLGDAARSSEALLRRVRAKAERIARHGRKG